MTRLKQVFEPIPENRKLYDRLYREVYLKMYGKLDPLFQEDQGDHRVSGIGRNIL